MPNKKAGPKLQCYQRKTYQISVAVFIFFLAIYQILLFKAVAIFLAFLHAFIIKITETFW